MRSSCGGGSGTPASVPPQRIESLEGAYPEPARTERLEGKVVLGLTSTRPAA